MLRKIIFDFDSKLISDLLKMKLENEGFYVDDMRLNEGSQFDLLITDKCGDDFEKYKDITKIVFGLYNEVEGIFTNNLFKSCHSFYCMRDGLEGFFIKLNLVLIGNRVMDEDLRKEVKSRKEAFDKFNGLDNRQKKICEYIYLGKKNREIAEALYLSLQSVKNEISVIYRILGISSRVELVNLMKLK